MPRQEDYELGAKAVELDLISQEQLENAIMDLCALERVGSTKRLVDVLIKQGVLAESQAGKFRTALGEAPAAPAPSPEEKQRPEEKDEAAALREAVAEEPKVEPVKELMDDTAAQPPKPMAPPKPIAPAPIGAPPASRMKTPVTVPPNNASEYCFIHTLGSGESRINVLPRKPIAIGREPANDIIVLDGPVSKRHARLTFSPEGMTLWDVGSKNGTFVNGEKITSKRLKEGDVVSVGNAYLIFARVDTPDGRIAGTITPNAPHQGATAILTGKDGFEGGPRFAVGEKTVLIGAEAPNNIRLNDPSVSPFHACIIITPDGVQLVDLNSVSGIKVNGEDVQAKDLEEGDIISVGRYTLHVDVVKEGTSTGKMKAIPATRAPTAALTPREPVEAAEEAETMLEPAPEPKPARKGPAPTLKGPLPVETVGEEEEDSDLAELGAALRREAGLAAKSGEDPAQPGRCRLVCIAGVIKTKSFPIDTAKMTFGRNPASDVFLEDLAVSREHAMVKTAGNKLEIVDLGSRNGIEVNGRKVMSKMLSVGDKIKIGKNVFLVESQE